jgi:hypothetical protein
VGDDELHGSDDPFDPPIGSPDDPGDPGEGFVARAEDFGRRTGARIRAGVEATELWRRERRFAKAPLWESLELQPEEDELGLLGRRSLDGRADDAL